jgi:hypothetical protein
MMLPIAGVGPGLARPAVAQRSTTFRAQVGSFRDLILFRAYAVQSATDLGPGVVWSANLPAPVIANGLSTLTNPVSGAQQYFRLAH